MPPKPKHSKDDIANTAFKILQEDGIQAVTAREIGKKLGVSSSPVFTWFDSMEEVYDSLRDKGWKFFASYLRDSKGKKLSFRRKLIAFVNFIKDNPKVFEYIFLHGTGKYHDILNEYFFFLREDEEELKEAYNISNKEASKVIEKLWIFSLGIGVLVANNINIYSNEELENILLETEKSLIPKS